MVHYVLSQDNNKVTALSDTRTRAHFVQTDVASWTSQVETFKAAARFSQSKSSLDIVIACAGVPGEGFFADPDGPVSLDIDPPEPKGSTLAFDVNAKGVYYTTRLARHYFGLNLAKGAPEQATFKKALILLSSLSGYLEVNNVDYGGAKWAVRGMFRAMRSKMEDAGYRTNLLAPWVMDTPMSKPLATVCQMKGIPVGKVEDIVDAAIRCAADEQVCGE